jgi:ribonuclease BN (tRNA processing enzyme)
MRMVTVGTGTAAPHARRVQAAVLVEHGGVSLLVDCGSGAVHRMATLGLDWTAVTHVALTHFHADHVSDVGTLVLGWRHGLIPPRAGAVTIIGPPGTRPLVERIGAALGSDLLAGPPPVSVDELTPGESRTLEDGDAALKLTARKTVHTDESVAYAVEAAGRRAVVTGDTAYDEDLAVWAAGADVLVTECSMPDEHALPHHLTPRQCGRLAALARPKLLALTHLYPPVEAVDVAAQVREHFDGPVALCHDGWAHTL